MRVHQIGVYQYVCMPQARELETDEDDRGGHDDSSLMPPSSMPPSRIPPSRMRGSL